MFSYTDHLNQKECQKPPSIRKGLAAAQSLICMFSYTDHLNQKECQKPPSIRKGLAAAQSLSHAHLFATPWTATRQAALSFAISWSLLRLLSVELVMPSNHLILCRPLLLVPSIFPSIRVFSNESVLRIRWPKYWSFSFNISLSNEYSGLISFRIDWFNLLAVQGTLKSFLQHHSSKASILPRSALFMVQLSHPYMTARKTIALTISIPHMEYLILCFSWSPTRLHEHWGQKFISLLLMATLLHAQSKAYFWLSEFTLVF